MELIIGEGIMMIRMDGVDHDEVLVFDRLSFWTESWGACQLVGDDDLGRVS